MSFALACEIHDMSNSEFCRLKCLKGCLCCCCCLMCKVSVVWLWLYWAVILMELLAVTSPTLSISPCIVPCWPHSSHFCTGILFINLKHYISLLLPVKLVGLCSRKRVSCCAASNLITEESDIDDTLEFLRLLSEISTHTALRSAPTLQFSQA